jgi:hypothetical protein
MAAVITAGLVFTVICVIRRGASVIFVLIRCIDMDIERHYRTIPKGTNNQPTENQRT